MVRRISALVINGCSRELRVALAESGPGMLVGQELVCIPLMGGGGANKQAAVFAAVLVSLSSKGRATSGYKTK